MSEFFLEELEIKSFEKLYKIALKEKLIDVYSNINSKKEIIDLILKYRGKNNLKTINKYNEKSFIKIQSFIDKKTNYMTKGLNDILVSRKIELYDKTIFNYDKSYYVLIDKNLNFNLNIVFLVGKNNYIYSILNLYLDVDYSNERYNKYIFSQKIISRFGLEFKNDEIMHFLFFDDYNSSVIYNLYNDINDIPFPDKINLVKVIIPEFSYKKIEKVNEVINIIIYDNKIKCEFFEKNFELYVNCIKGDEISYYFFEKCEKHILNKEFIIQGTYFDSIEKLCTNLDKELFIYDDTLNYIYMKKEKIYKDFINYLKLLINSYSKKEFKKYNIIGYKLSGENIHCLNKELSLNYNIIKNIINKNLVGNSQYLIISQQHDMLVISSNFYEIVEKDINYDVDIKTQIEYVSKELSYENIIEYIKNLIKAKICKVDFFDYTLKSIMEKIESGEYLKIKDSIKIKLLEMEKNFKTDYEKNKDYINDEFLEIKKNELILKYLAKKIYSYYINNKNFYEIDLKQYVKDIEMNFKINEKIYKYELDKILSFEIFNALNSFFKRHKLIDLLKKYEGINLSGTLIKKDIFYNILKEFIPGKLVSFDKNDENGNNIILKSLKQFDKDLILGNIKLKNKVIYKKMNYKIYIQNFKNDYKLIFDSTKEKISYDDKIDSIKQLNFLIENTETNESYEKNIIIDNEYIEKDEMYIEINQKYLNDIENGIIRIFILFNDKCKIKLVKRINDQIYISKYAYNLTD